MELDRLRANIQTVLQSRKEMTGLTNFSISFLFQVARVRTSWHT